MGRALLAVEQSPERVAVDSDTLAHRDDGVRQKRLRDTRPPPGRAG